MCGICGIVGAVDEGLLRSMLATITHRGPDDEGIYLTDTASGEQVGLGHRRLSIIDLSPGGHEPMRDESGKVWLTFNGEIYNFLELRKDLENRGYRFKSDSDAEVIIYAYIEWGTGCLCRFNGIFAFGIWDARDDSLFLARDRLGVKPVYYSQTPLGFAFASEIKAILAVPGVARELDLEALDQFMTFLWTTDPVTAFKNIWKLPPAHYLIHKGGRTQISEYWDVHFEEDHSVSESEWTERVRDQLARSVKSQLLADVPLGSFLSGGLDSSSIVALMSEGGKKKVTTYSFGFRPEDLRYDVVEDDIKYSRKVGKLFNTEYYEEFLEPKVVDLLPKLVYHMDEPVADPAIITSYLVCNRARQRLTVLLSGMGGDEVFAGYPRHLAMRLAHIYNLPPSFLTDPIVSRLPALRPGRLNYFFRSLRKLSKSAGQPEMERYLGFGTYFTSSEKADLYSGDLRSEGAEWNAYSAHQKYLDRVAGQHFINKMLYLDLKTFLPCLNLTYTDKTSMASSVEVRVPLLDHELIEMTSRIPANLKLRRLTRKYIFKRAAEQWLPGEIVHRKKAGFGAPVRAWLAKDLRPMVEDLLSESNITRRGYFNYSAVRRLIDDNLSGREDNALKVFQLLTFELWLREFIDSPSNLAYHSSIPVRVAV
ncbi:MAG TPA: asparagine synthase (glutamine-hydrolyzing) [Blastocatellia bacterium]|nr:asparagine synthase (glutamine-hydrolyzing) [Blastocatellia bacterium]